MNVKVNAENGSQDFTDIEIDLLNEPILKDKVNNILLLSIYYYLKLISYDTFIQEQIVNFLYICKSFQNKSIIKNDKISQLKELVKDETIMDVNATLSIPNNNEVEMSPLHSFRYYEKENLMEFVKNLLSTGADVNTKSEHDGSTPLNYLCKY